jgi:RimJ/RimL family protein N-acetyltransferase
MRLETDRLIVLSTPLCVVRRRLSDSDFALPVADLGPVRFPQSWPGDALVLFPMLNECLTADPAYEEWGGTIIDRETRVAVGSIGCKGYVAEDGSIEIGYGINPEAWGNGVATAAVDALIPWLLARPEVTLVWAECLTGNRASGRVLEKSGFTQVGRRWCDEEGGELLRYERR